MLSLDVLRVMAGASSSVFGAFRRRVETLIGEAPSDRLLGDSRKAIVDGLAELESALQSLQQRSDKLRADNGARNIAFAFARIYAGRFLFATCVRYIADVDCSTVLNALYAVLLHLMIGR